MLFFKVFVVYGYGRGGERVFCTLLFKSVNYGYGHAAAVPHFPRSLQYSALYRLVRVGHARKPAYSHRFALVRAVRAFVYIESLPRIRVYAVIHDLQIFAVSIQSFYCGVCFGVFHNYVAALVSEIAHNVVARGKRNYGMLLSAVRTERKHVGAFGAVNEITARMFPLNHVSRLEEKQRVVFHIGEYHSPPVSVRNARYARNIEHFGVAPRAADNGCAVQIL